MSIKISNITKYYGEQKALNEVSFEIKTGDIVGFLGPNGAGKSTMMKIITGALQQSAGKVSINEKDVTSENINTIKKSIGYLPEHNPLYLDMYIKEYLSYVAGIYGVKNKKQRIEKIIELTGLKIEQHKKIGALSKGYRQRVGIAQALIHNPDILILDEPTTGLDPNQILEIRNLIKEVAKEKTILLSTHIMQEVEAICNKVIIIDKGNIVANNDIQKIKSETSGNFIIEVEFDSEIDKNLIESNLTISQCQKRNSNIWILHSEKDIRSDIFKFAVNNNIEVLSLNKKEENLEDIFRNVTK